MKGEKNKGWRVRWSEVVGALFRVYGHFLSADHTETGETKAIKRPLTNPQGWM